MSPPDPDLPLSFRDPAGFVFTREGMLYRQINQKGREDYENLMRSGLYDRLVSDNLLIPHEQVEVPPERPGEAFTVIRPDRVPCISYPYEWSFSMIRDAALATLRIQQTALQFGMTLKDASGTNIQFVKGKPVLIDTLSLQRYTDGEPWYAYGQFCRHFMAPLALGSFSDIRLVRLLRVHHDGIPLDLARALLPFRSRFHIPTLLHIHLHGRWKERYGGAPGQPSRVSMSRTSLEGLVDHLIRAVAGYHWDPRAQDREAYDVSVTYSENTAGMKRKVVNNFLQLSSPQHVVDLGADVGLYSRIAARYASLVCALDRNPAAVEENYRQVRANGEATILPLWIDLTNPTPSTGWECQERPDLFHRLPCDTVLALAILHHLAITNNTPLSLIAHMLAGMCRHLIIEFIPRDDPAVQELLSRKAGMDIDYDHDLFTSAFTRYFTFRETASLPDSGRIVYLMERKVMPG